MSISCLYKDFVVVVKISRLKWYGHMLRKVEDDETRKVSEMVQAGTVVEDGKGWDGRRRWKKSVGLRRWDAKDRLWWQRSLHKSSSYLESLKLNLEMMVFCKTGGCWGMYVNRSVISQLMVLQLWHMTWWAMQYLLVKSNYSPSMRDASIAENKKMKKGGVGKS